MSRYSKKTLASSTEETVKKMHFNDLREAAVIVQLVSVININDKSYTITTLYPELINRDSIIGYNPKVISTSQRNIPFWNFLTSKETVTRESKVKLADVKNDLWKFHVRSVNFFVEGLTNNQ